MQISKATEAGHHGWVQPTVASRGISEDGTSVFVLSAMQWTRVNVSLTNVSPMKQVEAIPGGEAKRYGEVSIQILRILTGNGRKKKMKINVDKEDLVHALRKIASHDRFYGSVHWKVKEGRFLLCKEVYGDERDERTSATEMDCDNYFDDGANALYDALSETQSGKIIMDKVSKNDARMLVKWWNDHTLYQHYAVGRPDQFYDVVRR